ncbi:MAG: type III-B CRISPR module RAMP protein Cmr6 [Ktedonobacteraceae bacterium]|nr:type III-B CRISPR module RAMP protein Cmr6 [Ktedonobacteraceae bacterium]
MRREKGTHAGLWLDKYIGDQRREENESRRNLVNEVADLPEPAEYAAFYTRWQTMLKEGRAETREVRVRGRMVVGLGSESLLEASISLHRTYGVPYIPGSALKGLAASYAHHRLGEGWRKGETLHRIIFGDTDEAGYITFFDALLIPGTGRGGRALAPDVITVHHQKYYQNAEAVPSDSDDPNPIPFLSATGDYLLALAAPDFREQTRWVDLTFQILAEALEKLGIGAKTSSGYGRMTFLDAPIKPAHPELKIAEGYKREVVALRDVAGQIPGYAQKWKLLTLDEARLPLARAIVDKIEQAGRTKVTAEKAWYKELQAFLAENEENGERP